MLGSLARRVSSRAPKHFSCLKVGSVNSCWLTKRALDAGESARFSSVFFASAFFSLDGVPPSAPAQVTQAVGRLSSNCKQ
jgi:hypothetical protein